MEGRDLRYLLSITLLLFVLITAITGLIAQALDLNRFVPHRYSAYITMGLAAVHVYVNRRSVLAFVGRQFMRRPKAEMKHERGPTATAATVVGQQRVSRRGFAIGALSAGAGFVVGRLPWWGSWPMPTSGQDLGQVYHQWSKPSYGGVLSKALFWGLPPPLYKTYPQAHRVTLSPTLAQRGLNAEEAIHQRRSVRDYSSEPLTLAELSALLHGASGITQPGSYPLRAAPSAGALYPIEVYPVVHRVEGLASGVYHYAVADHTLEFVREGDLGLAMVQAAVGQDMAGQAAVTFVLTAIFQRTRWKYQDRAYRYVLLEAGHIGQNLYLVATSLGLGACAVGAFFDDDLNRLLGVDGVDEATVYLLTVGKV